MPSCRLPSANSLFWSIELEGGNTTVTVVSLWILGIEMVVIFDGREGKKD